MNVNLSDMCVILSAKMSAVEDPSMADKEAVLATLNINAMTFNKVRTNVWATQPGLFLQYDLVPVEFCSVGGEVRQGEIYGCKVRTVLTEVVNDSNIQYLNPDDDDEPGVQLYVTQVSSIYHLTLYNIKQYLSSLTT